MNRLRDGWFSAVLLWVFVATACVTNTYQVPVSELERLTSLEPAKRGDRVRVIQETGSDDKPALQEGWYAYGSKEDKEHEASGEPEEYDPWLWDEDEDAAGVLWIHHHNAHPWHHGRPIRVRPHRGGPYAGVGGKLAKISSKGSKAEDEKAAAIIVVLLAVAITTTLAVTEAQRYDGWVSVDPNHPIHLRYDDGTAAAAWLSRLRPGDLSGLESAYLLHDEGNGLTLIRRAPLYRRGGSWKLELGMSSVDVGADSLGTGWAARMHLGLFASDMVGMGLTLKYEGGDLLGGDYFNLHYGIDLHLMPLRLGKVHAGAFGGVGLAYTVAGGGTLPDFEDHTVGYEAGGVVEFELSTRLAISAKVGTSWYHRAGGLENSGLFVLGGLSIY